MLFLIYYLREFRYWKKDNMKIIKSIWSYLFWFGLILVIIGVLVGFVLGNWEFILLILIGIFIIIIGLWIFY